MVLNSGWVHHFGKTGSRTGVRAAVHVFVVLVSLSFSVASESIDPLQPGNPETVVNGAVACQKSSDMAAIRHRVPVPVMRAITLTETGRKRNGRVKPWPWTVNMEGKGIWFETRPEAEAYVLREHGRGARSYDIGCFQINFRWHGQAFSSPLEMFEPAKNADYAAAFLRALYDEFGDWSVAAGAYHSRNPKYATRYRARFDRILADIGEVDIQPRIIGAFDAEIADVTAGRSVNTFPLLRDTGAPRSAGSAFSSSLIARQNLLVTNRPARALWGE